jgi:hypothetical protein
LPAVVQLSRSEPARGKMGGPINSKTNKPPSKPNGLPVSKNAAATEFLPVRIKWLGDHPRSEALENRCMLSAAHDVATAPGANIEAPGQGTVTFAQSTTAASPAALVTANGQIYQQAFDAEFNGATLDTRQWNTDLNGQLSEPANGDQGDAAASQDVVSGGQLLLGVSDAPAGTTNELGQPVRYLEGAINSSSFVLSPNSIFQWQGILNWDHACGWATSLTDADHASYIGEIDNGEEKGRGNLSNDVHVDPSGPPSPAPAAGIISSPANGISSAAGVKIDPTQLNTYTAVYNADGTVSFYVTPTYGPGAGQTFSAGTSDGLAFNPNDPGSNLAVFFSIETDQNYGDFDADANGITTTASVMKADGDTTPQPRDYAMVVNWARVYSVPRAPTSTVTLPATADAYVQDGAYSKVNYGSVTPLLVKDAAPGGGWVRTAYLEFNLSGADPITYASLNLYGSEEAGAGEPSINVAVYPVPSSNWTESTITDGNAPAIGSTALATATITGTSPRVYSFNVSSYLEQQQAAGAANVTLAVEGTSVTTGTVAFSSSQAASNQPQLALTTVTPTPTPPLISVAPTADAYDRDGAYATQNLGASALLMVKDAVSGGGYVRNTYLTFDLQGMTPIEAAVLQVYGNETAGSPESSITLAAYPVASTSWAQNTITFDNAPAVASPAIGTVAITGTTPQEYSLDLTTYLQQQQALGNTLVSVALEGVGPTDGGTQFNSTLAATNQPDLLIQSTPAPTPAPTTTVARISIPATADSYVQDGSYAKTNYGSATPLLVKDAVAGDGYVRTAYLQFSLTGIAPITSATLELYGSELAGAPEPAISVAVYPVVNSNWTESTITDANAPAVGGLPLATAIITGTTPKLYSFDLSTYLEQQQAAGAAYVTVAIRGTTYSDGMAGFNSCEAASNTPQLVLWVS